MDNLLAERDIGIVSEVGWLSPGDMDFNEWMRIGNTFQRIDASINWWIGDWLNVGERLYGEKYAQAIEVTGWKYKRLAQCKWVSAKVGFSVRKESLTWTHHWHVAKLKAEDQAQWLEAAVNWDWNSTDLKDALKTKSLPKPEEKDDDVPFSGSGPDNYGEAAPAVEEYEQVTGPLPVLTWTSMEQVQSLVRAVLGGDYVAATELAHELRWLEQDDDWELRKLEVE